MTRPGELPAHEIGAVFGDAAVAESPAVVEALPHTVVASATAGLWRVRVGDRAAVVKVLAHAPEGGSENWRSGAAETHWYYWRREAEAYRSGLLDGLGGGLRAPRCDLTAERDDGSVALWLEDLRGQPAPWWSIDRYRLAARHLGQAQGEFVAGLAPGPTMPSATRTGCSYPAYHRTPATRTKRALPDHPWLSRGWLRSYLAQPLRKLTVTSDPAVWRDPLLADWFPEPPTDRLRAMGADRPRFLDVLDHMPATVCHLDLHPANLFDGGGDTTAVIDWSFVGIGAIGEDAGNLVPDAVLDFHVAAGQLPDLYDAVADGYAAGLRDAGWSGLDATVRLAMSATMAAKYAWIGPALVRSVAEGRSLLNGRPIAEAVSWWAPTVRFLLDRAQEARDLSGQAHAQG